MRIFGLGLLAAAAVLCLGSSAYADLTGNTVDVDFLYPNITTSTLVGSTTVPGSVTYNSQVQISLTGDLVTITALGSGADFATASFNGFSVTDTSNPSLDIIGVELVGDSPSGLTSTADVTFTSNEVFFNFEDENWCNCGGTSYFAEYELFFAPSNVPEPPTAALLGAALAGFGLFFARRRMHGNGQDAVAA